MRLAPLILFWGALNSPCLSEEPSPATAPAEPVLLDEVEIIIDHNTKAKSVVAKWKVKIHEKAVPAFGDAPLHWNAFEFVKEAKLRCIQDGQDDNARRLSIGEDTNSDFMLHVSNREYITKENEPELSLSVPHPQSFSPGIYHGKLRFRFSGPEQSNIDIAADLPITVAVRGRRLVDFRFTHAQNKAVRFGSPADVEVKIDTIDCDLGQGDFQFSHQPSAAAAPQSLTLSIPFAESEFKDPKLALKPSTYPASWSKTAFWTDESATTDVPSVMKVRPHFSTWKRHTVTLHLGECNDLGKIEGGIKWPQAETAPGTERSELTKEIEADVLEGIKAAPRLAFRGETIELSLASSVDLGKKVKIIVIDQEGKPEEREFTKSEPHGKGDASKVKVTGQPHLYTSSYASRRYGTFLVRFPDEIVKQHPSLRALEKTSPEIRVWLERRDTTKQSPLRVFASAPPFWWSWLSDPFKGKGWRETRPEMFEFEFDKGRLSDVSVKLSSMSTRPLPPLRAEFSPTLDPQLTIDDPKHPAKVKKLTADDPKQSAKAHSYVSERQWEEINPPLSLQGEVSFGSPENQELVKKRPIIGLWKYPFRMHIRGVSNGASVTRIVELTVPVEVTTEWVYYHRIKWWIVGTIAFIALLRWLYITVNPRRRSASGSSGPISDIINPPAKDTLSEFMSPTSRPAPVADRPTTTAADEPKAGPSRNLPRNDDLDDFLDSKR